MIGNRHQAAPAIRLNSAFAVLCLVGRALCLPLLCLLCEWLYASVAVAAESEEAFSALRANRCVDAADLFENILQTAPGSMDARYGRGLSRLCLGEYDAAIEDLQLVAASWPEKLEVAFELGAALTSSGAYREAEGWLKKAQAGADFKAPAALLLGLGQLRLGNLGAALDHFQLARERSATLATQAKYYSGVAEYRASNFATARQYFSEVVQEAPTSALAREADAFLGAIDSRRRDLYRAFGSLGFEYDSNVVLAPVQDLGPGEQQADGRFVLRAGGIMTPLRRPNLRLDVGYSLFQSLHLELGDFNLQAHELFADTTTTTPWGRAGVSHRFQYYLRKDDLHRFLGQWSSRPFTVVSLAPSWEAELYYRYRGRDFVESQFNSLGLDGAAHAAGLRHILDITSSGRLVLGYQFERDDLRNMEEPQGSSENPFTNDAHAVISELAWTLPWSLESSLAYTFAYRVYSPASRESGARRHDTNHSVSATVRYPVTQRIEILCGYLGMFNDSNQALYEYRRHVAIAAASFSY